MENKKLIKARLLAESLLSLVSGLALIVSAEVMLKGGILFGAITGFSKYTTPFGILLTIGLLMFFLAISAYAYLNKGNPEELVDNRFLLLITIGLVVYLTPSMSLASFALTCSLIGIYVILDIETKFGSFDEGNDDKKEVPVTAEANVGEQDTITPILPENDEKSVASSLLLNAGYTNENKMVKPSILRYEDGHDSILTEDQEDTQLNADKGTNEEEQIVPFDEFLSVISNQGKQSNQSKTDTHNMVLPEINEDFEAKMPLTVPEEVVENDTESSNEKYIQDESHEYAEATADLEVNETYTAIEEPTDEDSLITVTEAFTLLTAGKITRAEFNEIKRQNLKKISES